MQRKRITVLYIIINIKNKNISDEKKIIFYCSPHSFLAIRLHSIAQESLHISIDEAKEHALNYNKTIQKANLAIQKADYAKWQSIASLLPKSGCIIGL